MTDINLDEIRNRTLAATEGPWRMMNRGNSFDGEAHCAQAVVEGLRRPFHESYDNIAHPHDVKLRVADADFVAHARTDIPALLDEVDRLRDNESQHHIDLSNMTAVHELAESEHRRAEAAETETKRLRGNLKYLRKNKVSGCACKIDDDGETVLQFCDVHKLILLRAEAAEAVVENIRVAWDNAENDYQALEGIDKVVTAYDKAKEASK